MRTRARDYGDVERDGLEGHDFMRANRAFIWADFRDYVYCVYFLCFVSYLGKIASEALGVVYLSQVDIKRSWG
jgi:hypothetical protein